MKQLFKTRDLKAELERALGFVPVSKSAGPMSRFSVRNCFG